MGRRINPEFIAEWYNPYELKAMFLHAGYDDYGSVAKDMLHVSSEKTARKKINHTVLSHEDTLALARGLNMTPREYMRIFCKGVFEDEE